MGMTKEDKDKLLHLMTITRNLYVEDTRERIATEYGRIEGADYMLERLRERISEVIEDENSITGSI